MDSKVGTILTTFVSTGEWFDWLTGAQQALIDEYLLRGGRRLISDYRHESNVVREYVGREILELLQNAGDQAADAGIEGKVAIQLSKSGLVVANTGTPFSAEGVDSLQTANLSPKKRARRSLIGEKGLGFRAVLNWTDCPFISSGALRLVFSRRYASSIQDSLQASSAELAERIAKERDGTEVLILPRLAFPAFDSNGDLNSWFDTPEQSTIAARCEALRKEGFDTAIGMPFRKPQDFEIAKKQLEELRPEILLFVESLHEISIQVESEEVGRTWSRVKTGEDLFQVVENGGIVGTWDIFRSGMLTVPEDQRDESSEEAQDYEIVIAIPRDRTREGNPLFTYFPTEVIVPHPVVCHATLHLDESRKHPTAGKANRYILTRLAEYLAEIAEKRTSLDDPWGGLRFICASGEYPVELKQAGFAEALRGAVAKRQLVPCLDGEFRCPGEALLLKGATDAWLPPKCFPELARYPEKEEEWKWLSGLSIPELGAEEFAGRLSGEALSDSERVTLIAGIIRQKLPDDFHRSDLLLDATGKSVGPGSRIFFSPSGDPPVLPDWVHFRFLSRDLRERLQEALGLKEQRELQHALSDFGVVEYSQASMIQAVVAEANRLCKRTPDEETRVRGDLLRMLLGLFREGRREKGKLGTFPSVAGMALLSRKGTYQAARSLYLSDGYGLAGKISHGLYGSWAPEKLVASRDELGIEGAEEELAKFLRWLGVERFPREEHGPPRDPRFRDDVIASLDYPARFGNDYTFAGAGEAKGVWVEEACSVDGLNEILNSASPVAILGWLAADLRWEEWRQSRSTHGTIKAKRGADRSSRRYDGPIPSYVAWKTSATEWLPVASGELRAPQDCLIASKHIEVLFPRPADFSPEEKEPFGILSNADLFRAWERAGVLPGLERLDLDQIYGLLVSMPEKSTDGKAARALARWLLDNKDIVFGLRGPNYDKFVQNGRMWGSKHGDEGYFPIAELWHRDSESLPREVLEQLAIVDLPTRAGATRVHRLFRVRSLGEAIISQSVANHRLAPMSEEENGRFQGVKPFLKRLRESQSASADNLAALDRLTLVLCDQLAVRLVVEGKESQIEVANWEGLVDGDCLFLKVDGEEGDRISQDLLTDSIGTAVAGLFGLTNGDAFAKLCRCHPRDRSQLLRRMCGEESLAGLVSLEEAEMQLRTIPIHKVKPQSAKQTEENKSGEVDTEPALAQAGEENVSADGQESTPPEVIDGLEVTPQTHTPREPQSPRKMVVRRVGAGGGGTRRGQRVTDGDLCERLAFIFEEQEGRFPIAMGNITGVEGAGCDIFSFASAEDRSRFEADEPRDMSLVSRFVEVKGRSDSGAKIDLRGNEFACARRETKRYFLYRFGDPGDGTYSLTILQDPLQEEGAITRAVIVDLDAAKTSQRFDLRPVVKDHQEEEGLPADPTGSSAAN